MEAVVQPVAVTVIEVFRLQPRHAHPRGATQAGWSYEKRLHQNAHASAGYVGHASFHFEAPDRLVVVYPWADGESLRALLESEEPLLAPFYAEFCVGKREVRCLEPLSVEPC